MPLSPALVGDCPPALCGDGVAGFVVPVVLLRCGVGFAVASGVARDDRRGEAVDETTAVWRAPRTSAW